MLENSALSRKTARNALLPQLSLYGFYAGTGYAGIPNPASATSPSHDVPPDLTVQLQNAFNHSSPEYQVGLQLKFRCGTALPRPTSIALSLNIGNRRSIWKN